MYARNSIQYEEPELPPVKSEVVRAMHAVANKKASGIDNICRTLKERWKTVIARLHYICIALWETAEWPEDWADSVVIPLLKKSNTKQCTNHRTIALASHGSKIILKIVQERIKRKTEMEIAEEQVGSCPGKGTKDQTTNLRLITQNAQVHRQPSYMCFVDCSNSR